MVNPKSKYYQIPMKTQILNPSKGKVFDIRERTFYFSKRILEIAERIPNNHVCNILCKQLIRSGTSIGANVEEGDGTTTKRDFMNKMNIARKEAKETKYWLRLISGKFMNKDILEKDIIEVQEIINILSTIIKNTKSSYNQ